jgi:hypothetical protein
MYLRPVDDMLVNAGLSMRGGGIMSRWRKHDGTAVRWVDDVAIR